MAQGAFQASVLYGELDIFHFAFEKASNFVRRL